jgi:hypothetical protein
MIRTSLLIAIAGALVGLGWTVAKAQSSQPNFEIVINAPEGETTVQCVRGCNLAFVERGLNPNQTPTPTFTFNCRNAPDRRCSSMKVGGWITSK